MDISLNQSGTQSDGPGLACQSMSNHFQLIYRLLTTAICSHLAITHTLKTCVISLLIPLSLFWKPRPDGQHVAPPPAAQTNPLISVDPHADLHHGLALLVNIHGELCAKVIKVRLLHGDVYELTGVRYRDGSGTANYEVNLESGAVKQGFLIMRWLLDGREKGAIEARAG